MISSGFLQGGEGKDLILSSVMTFVLKMTLNVFESVFLLNIFFLFMNVNTIWSVKYVDYAFSLMSGSCIK